MGTLADKRLGDFLPTIDAYRPVALTVAAILGLVIVLPGAERPDSATAEFAASSASASDTTVAAAPATTTPTTAPPTTVAGDASVPTASEPFAPSSPAPRPAPSRSPSSSPEAPAADDRSAVAPPSVSGGFDADDSEPEPLRIVASGWASATGGSPLSGSPADDVPEGTLPVGSRVGQTDKISFIRLSGDETTLVLAEDAAGRRGNEFETSPVELCPITDGAWEPGGDQPMSEAPSYDSERCVAVEQQPDGTWAVNLFVFEDPADERGFALVPSADAPLDFQVTFGAQALS